jgi:ketosteroid isomerase-like protein
MSERSLKLTREAYTAYNETWSAPNPGEAIRVWLERFVDPGIEWETEASGPEAQVFRGISGVMEFFALVLGQFEYVRQVPECFIDCGDRILVFVRTESRARSTGLELNEEWAHLVAMRHGKAVRWHEFRHRAEALEAAGRSD